MSLVVLDHMRGLKVSFSDILYIYNVKSSRIPHELYISSWLGMSRSITRAPSTNKELDRGIIVVSRNWEFRVSKPSDIPHVPRIHGITGMTSMSFIMLVVYVLLFLVEH